MQKKPSIGEVLRFLIKAFSINIPNEKHGSELYWKQVQRFATNPAMPEKTQNEIYVKILKAFSDSLEKYDKMVFRDLHALVAEYKAISENIKIYDTDKKQVLWVILWHFFLPFAANIPKVHSFSTFPWDVYIDYFGNNWFLPKREKKRIVLPISIVARKQRELANLDRNALAEILDMSKDKAKIEERYREIVRREEENIIPTEVTIQNLLQLNQEYKQIYSEWGKMNLIKRKAWVQNWCRCNLHYERFQTINYKKWVEGETLSSLIGDNSQYSNKRYLKKLKKDFDLFLIWKKIDDMDNPFSDSDVIQLLSDARYISLTKSLRKMFEFDENRTVKNWLKVINDYFVNYNTINSTILERAFFLTRTISFAYRQAENYFGKDKAWELVIRFKELLDTPLPARYDENGYLNLAQFLSPEPNRIETISMIERELLSISLSKN